MNHEEYKEKLNNDFKKLFEVSMDYVADMVFRISYESDIEHFRSTEMDTETVAMSYMESLIDHLESNPNINLPEELNNLINAVKKIIQDNFSGGFRLD